MKHLISFAASRFGDVIRLTATAAGYFAEDCLMSRLPHQIFASAIALSAGIVLNCQANAHAHLKAATPPIDGKTTPRTSELDLIFSEGVNLRFSGVGVTGPDGQVVATGAPRLNGGNGSILVVPFAGPLSAGVHRVTWHALANDGHKSTGSYTFTVAP